MGHVKSKSEQVDVVGRPGGEIHTLLIRRFGDQRSRKNRALTVVRAVCPHSEAERVLQVLASPRYISDTNCDWAAGVLQYLLRQDVAVVDALVWAALPIKPWHPHWMYLWKVQQRPWCLNDLDLWRTEGGSPEEWASKVERQPFRDHQRLR